MGPIIKLSRVKKQMKDQPAGQRLNDFFFGETNLLTKEQIKELKKIVQKEHKKLMAYLQKAEKKVA